MKELGVPPPAESPGQHDQSLGKSSVCSPVAVEIIRFAKEQGILISKAQPKHEYFRSFPRVPTQWMSALVQMKGFLNLFYWLFISFFPGLSKQGHPLFAIWMIFVVGQLKNHVTLAASQAGAAQVFITDCTRAGVGSSMGGWGEILKTEIRDGRMDNMKDFSMYFYLSILTGSEGKYKL